MSLIVYRNEDPGLLSCICSTSTAHCILTNSWFTVQLDLTLTTYFPSSSLKFSEIPLTQ